MNVETFAEKLPVLARFALVLHFPGLLSEDGLISYVLLMFCLYFLSSGFLNDIPVPAFSTVIIIIIAAIYLIATHYQPHSAFSTDSPRYQMHNAFPSEKSDLARICSLVKTPSWQAPRLCGNSRCVRRHRERWFPFSLRV